MVSYRARKASNGVNHLHSPSHLLRRCEQYANDLFAREPNVTNLTRQQFIVLAALEHNSGVSQIELVALTGIDRSTLAEMVRRMKSKNLLDRERATGNRRANALRILLEGRKALERARSANEEADKAVLCNLPAADRTRFLQMLALIAARAGINEKRTPTSLYTSSRRSR
jgi:DNA-binding MarR family transcriptional regulator